MTGNDGKMDRVREDETRELNFELGPEVVRYHLCQSSRHDARKSTITTNRKAGSLSRLLAALRFSAATRSANSIRPSADVDTSYDISTSISCTSIVNGMEIETKTG
jgi:hypothetical protein